MVAKHTVGGSSSVSTQTHHASGLPMILLWCHSVTVYLRGGGGGGQTLDVWTNSTNIQFQQTDKKPLTVPHVPMGGRCFLHTGHVAERVWTSNSRAGRTWLDRFWFSQTFLCLKMVQRVNEAIITATLLTPTGGQWNHTIHTLVLLHLQTSHDPDWVLVLFGTVFLSGTNSDGTRTVDRWNHQPSCLVSPAGGTKFLCFFSLTRPLMM